jgi:hypothetical protein
VQQTGKHIHTHVHIWREVERENSGEEIFQRSLIGGHKIKWKVPLRHRMYGTSILKTTVCMWVTAFTLHF